MEQIITAAALCKSIVSGQTAEIKEMRRIMMTGK